MRSSHYIALFPMLFLTMMAEADPCQQVVEDTVAEIRAGASAWRTEDAEGLVRAAAGSACVKALSGRYADVAANTAIDVAAESEPVAAEVEAKASASSETLAKDGAFSIGGITVRSMSGSPSKKPYERGRESDKPAE